MLSYQDSLDFTKEEDEEEKFRKKEIVKSLSLAIIYELSLLD